ncbi:ZSC30 protein, partial [Cnemophilus loriae]|nr:ZSC30 protein [Cnemophilus loriae]
WNCLECGTSFSQSSHLIWHQEIQTMEHPYCCLECGKTFIWKQSFRKNSHHIKDRMIHTGEWTYECLECRKSFSRSSKLITHRCIHTRVRRYECP